MNSSLADFIELAKKRNADHIEAFRRLVGMPSQQAGIIRYEIDTLIRVAYVFSLSLPDREVFCAKFFESGKFCDISSGKRLTDKVLVDRIQGWESFAYQVGCGFAHLSYLHSEKPCFDLSKILGVGSSQTEKYLNEYHNRPIVGHLQLGTVLPYLPAVFEKIYGNTQYYIEELEAGEPPYF